MFGNLANGLSANPVHTANGQFVLVPLGKVWKLRWFGIGVSYFGGDKVDSWTAGVDVRFAF